MIKVAHDEVKKFIPLLHRLLIEMDQETVDSQYLSSVIILPYLHEDKNMKSVTGRIRAVGPGLIRKKTGKRIPMDPRLKKGARVILGFYMGDHLKGEDNVSRFRIVSDNQLLGFLDEGDVEVLDPASISPIGNRVLVRLDGPVEKSRGGLIIPYRAQRSTRRGKVIAVGPGKILDDGTIAPMEVEPGDDVLMASSGGIDAKICSEDHIALSEGQILGVVGDAESAEVVPY